MKKVLLVGDVMLDRFVYGTINRISPEAPVPILLQNEEQLMLGGAGNVLRNLVALGNLVFFVSAVGDDWAGRKIKELASVENSTVAHIFKSQAPTIQKLRYVAGNQQLLRHDVEDLSIPVLNEYNYKYVLDTIKDYARQVDVIVFSDYNKGLYNSEFLQMAREVNPEIIIIVDPKCPDWNVYRGANYLTPNVKEVLAALGGIERPHETDLDFMSLAGLVRGTYTKFDLIITRGKDGISIVNNLLFKHIPGLDVDAVDVSGAGDTVVATLATCLANGETLGCAAEWANKAGAIAVSRKGTAVVSYEDLYGEYPVVWRNVLKWQERGLKIGFMNGCFDLLHFGHLQAIQEASTMCDKLIIGVNSDESVKRLKGEDRPYNDLATRNAMLQSLKWIDLAIPFHEDTPEKLIMEVKPSILFKSEDYKNKWIAGADFVKSYGGEVILLPYDSNYSSTSIIKKLRK